MLLAASATAIAKGKRPALGFDVRDYPGDAVMKRLRARYRFVGYYLVSPNHPGDSWKGAWPRLRRMGWGVGILYVGQQKSELTFQRGIDDALDASRKAAAEGFAPGGVVFLDVERQEALSPEMKEYVAAWIAHVRTNRRHRYRPGIYCHVRNADELRAVAAAAGAKDAPFWVSGGTGDFDVGARPEDSGVAWASSWQGLLDGADPFGAAPFALDVSVSRAASPSYP